MRKQQMQVGWMPWCISGVMRGPWNTWAFVTKKEVVRAMKDDASGFKYVVVPVYVDVPVGE